MHSATICFGPAATTWVLLFKEEAGAAKIYDAYIEARRLNITGPLIGSDDFGQAFAIHMEQISGILIDDMDLSQQAYIERGLHNARAQAKAQQRAASDPTLRAAAMTQGPAALSPFGGNRMS